MWQRQRLPTLMARCLRLPGRHNPLRLKARVLPSEIVRGLLAASPRHGLPNHPFPH